MAEINAVDLFSLECLRTFAPASYEALSQHKSILTGRGSILRQDQAEKERIRSKVGSIVDLASKDYRDGVEQIIQKLFPTLDWVFRNMTYDGATHVQWLRESRVCCPEVFDRYFELALPVGGVSNSLLHSLKSLLTDHKRFCEVLQRQDEPQQGAILDRLEAHVDDFPLEQSDAVVVTLLNAGEVVVGGQSTMTTLSTDTIVSHLLRFFLQRHEEPAVRSGLLVSAFEQAKGFNVLMHLLSWESSSRRKSEPSDLDDAGFDQLRSMFVSALLTQADKNPEAFLGHWNFVSFAYRLDAFADGAGSQWIKRQVTTLERFILFAIALVGKSTSYSGDVVSEHHFVRITQLDELLGIEECRGWMSQIQQDALSGPAKQAVDLVAQALDRHQRAERIEWD
ncbi:hypothetical protein FQZ97_705230 [compost metagenome]